MIGQYTTQYSLVLLSNFTLYSSNAASQGLSPGSGLTIGSDHWSNTCAAQQNLGPPFVKALDKELPLQSVSNKLFAMIGKPATSWDGTPWGDGCIYVLQIPGCLDYVKIGRTEEDPHKRMNQQLSCGYELEIIDKGSFTKVPFHQRVEKLIHQDLRNMQHTFLCSCKRTKKKGSADDSDGLTEHGEWFKINPQEAINTVNKWRDWMHQEPYDGYGDLKSDWRNRIAAFARDKSYNSKTIVDEDRAGKRWETFLSGPSVVSDALFMKRQDSMGRPLDSRWKKMCRHKVDIFTYCSVHWVFSRLLFEQLGPVYPSICRWLYLGMGLFGIFFWL